MNAKEWHKKYGWDGARSICRKLGVSDNYWKGVVHRTQSETPDKGISHQRAFELARISDELTGDPMTVLDLLGLSDKPAHLIGKVREKA